MRAARGALEAGETQLGALLRARYIAGEHGVVRLLLSGEDPNRTARNLTYYEYVSQAQAALVHDLQVRIARLSALEARARETGAALAALEREAQTERDALLAQARERRRILARISGEIEKQRGELATLGRDEQRLARLVDQLGRALREAPPPPRLRNEAAPGAARVGAGSFAEAKGKLLLPVRGELAGRFGAPREDSGLAWKGCADPCPGGRGGPCGGSGAGGIRRLDAGVWQPPHPRPRRWLSQHLRQQRVRIAASG
ncbi:MAG: hypothetical protein M5U08_26400 [Burkholderiales bacterium]|nr:hypothetical protein [Burkholderiales bacterium]